MGGGRGGGGVLDFGGGNGGGVFFGVLLDDDDDDVGVETTMFLMDPADIKKLDTLRNEVTRLVIFLALSSSLTSFSNTTIIRSAILSPPGILHMSHQNR